MPTKSRTRKNLRKNSRKNSRRMSKKLSRKNLRKNLRKRNSIKRSRKNKKLRGGSTLEPGGSGGSGLDTIDCNNNCFRVDQNVDEPNKYTVTKLPPRRRDPLPPASSARTYTPIPPWGTYP